MNKNTPAAQVIAETSKKIRGFLYELAEGITNYRSLHSLTEQIEHQYHGRVIIELIQNAHDALSLAGGLETGRIEIVLKRDDGEFGTLYVANDGKCFSQSNFESLSQLGQSDKNPENSIGNKGIGFRSVLEITSSPEIYSRLAADSDVFDGFCFKFSPSFIEQLAAPIFALLRGEPCGDLVDWDESLRKKFRDTVGEKGESWLRRELQYLSPYLLPFPIEPNGGGAMVSEFEKRGFATVVRLPLKAPSASQVLQEKLHELEGTTLVFLDKAKHLIVDDGTNRREFLRQSFTRHSSQLGRTEVIVTGNSSSTAERYWLWTRNIVISNSPDTVKEALKNLPGKWPQLQQTAITLGVRLADAPQTGVLSIFLPTLLKSGCGANINAPFFGDMSRTLIDFKNSYNDFLLKEASMLALQLIAEELAGNGLDEARVIVDLLAPAGSDNEACSRWQSACHEAATETRFAIGDVACFFSDQGWRTLAETSLIPDARGSSVITRNALREHATFAGIVSGLDSRAQSICELAKTYGISAFPIKSELADTVEALAQSLRVQKETDWNGFWTDAESLFGGDSTPLLTKLVLLGNDEQLYASSETCAVFFSPRQGVVDNDEISPGADSVPATLKGHIAFLSERITVSDERGSRPKSPIRRFLEGKLVNRFHVEDIFRSVLLKQTPQLPIALDDPLAPLCNDILLWGLRLMSHLVERGKGDKSFRLLISLPVPCQSGWLKLDESSFGAGWPGTMGDVLLKFLTNLPRPQSKDALARLLLPPSDPRWQQAGLAHQKLMHLAGVFDGLRLSMVASKDWNSTFQGGWGTLLLPATPPPGVGGSLWASYRKYIETAVKPYYQNWFSYEVQTLYTFSGFALCDALDDEARLDLMSLLLGSLGAWGKSWSILSFKKKEGYSDSPTAESPLVFFLRTHAWLGLTNGGRLEWFLPRERWHVPAQVLGGNAWQFDHLKPLPTAIAYQLDSNLPLMEVLRSLDMPRYETEIPSANTRLLDDLAIAVQKLETTKRNFYVFLGQVRSAWKNFHPEQDSPFPSLLIVGHAGTSLTAELPSADRPIYLPNSSKSFAAAEQFDLPVLAIDINDARRLAAKFTEAYGAAVRTTSTLELVPLVGRTPWSGLGEGLLYESEFGHLVPLILTLAAFTGGQRLSSKRFQIQMATFRAAKVAWVADLRAALYDGENQLAAPATEALWLKDKSVLLVTEKCRIEPALLGEALSHLIDQDDLEIPIKLLLQGFTNLEPENDDIVRAFRRVKLLPEHLQEVREHWNGDLNQILRMIIPLLTLLRPDADLSRMMESKTSLELDHFLNELHNSRFSSSDILKLCRASADMFDLGQNAWRQFGESLQLGKWNALMTERGETVLLNREAATAFRLHLGTALSPLRSLLATIAHRNVPNQGFKTLYRDLEAMSCPPDFERELWEVDFQRTMVTTLPYFDRWGASPIELEAIRMATCRIDLEEGLRQAGIDISSDPLETARVNLDKLRGALHRLQQIGLAWALATHRANASAWECRVDQFLTSHTSILNSQSYLSKWSDEEVFAMLQNLPQEEGDEDFWNGLSQSQCLRELTATLGLSDEMLEYAHEKLRAFKEDVRRKGRLVEIGGEEFDASEDNFTQLFEHIRKVLPDEQMDNMSTIDLRIPSIPSSITPTTSSAGRSGSPSASIKIKRSSKAMEALVGLTGEIHAYRMLKKHYNAGPENWISGNGNIVFPENRPDDGRGCDFEIAFKDRTYFVEVKASESEAECFILGSSEMRLAMEVARRARPNRKNVFIILHITRALSDQPAFRLLPNPYDPRYQPLFLMDGADVRVRYRTEAGIAPL
ncbi:MAG: hypothetical protein JWL59_3438 [Chthoniobacteraceae bacterium]|nr:hypothetical protein [Chthoniobacteraceae bacterium]